MVAQVPCDTGPCTQARIRGSDAVLKQGEWILGREHKVFLINVRKLLTLLNSCLYKLGFPILLHLSEY